MPNRYGASGHHPDMLDNRRTSEPGQSSSHRFHRKSTNLLRRDLYWFYQSVQFDFLSKPLHSDSNTSYHSLVANHQELSHFPAVHLHQGASAMDSLRESRLHLTLHSEFPTGHFLPASLVQSLRPMFLAEHFLPVSPGQSLRPEFPTGHFLPTSPGQSLRPEFPTGHFLPASLVQPLRPVLPAEHYLPVSLGLPPQPEFLTGHFAQQYLLSTSLIGFPIYRLPLPAGYLNCFPMQHRKWRYPKPTRKPIICLPAQALKERQASSSTSFQQPPLSFILYFMIPFTCIEIQYFYMACKYFTTSDELLCFIQIVFFCFLNDVLRTPLYFEICF